MKDYVGYGSGYGSAPWISSKETMTTLIVEPGITRIGNNAFCNCSKFTGNLTLPVGLTSIGGDAFYNCAGFDGNLTLPVGLTSIGGYAFYNCTGFDGNLTLPVGLTSIGSSAFCYCYNFTGTLTLPEGLTSIGEFVFDQCFKFTGNLTLPESLTEIGSGAFEYCTGLTSIYNLNPTPQILNFYSPFRNLGITLYVPSQNLAAYAEADVWKDFTIIGCIANLDDLKWLSGASSAWGGHFIQTADIDASATAGWDDGKGFSPIGNYVPPFTGTYDGGGHIITRLTINRPEQDNVGMFGVIGSGFKVENLGLVG
jgi:hypothetical protein